jgi:hypothetical protein
MVPAFFFREKIKSPTQTDRFTAEAAESAEEVLIFVW